jgi:hypothetical protein
LNSVHIFDISLQKRILSTEITFVMTKVTFANKVNFVNRNAFCHDKIELLLLSKLNFVNRNDFSRDKSYFCVQK